MEVEFATQQLKERFQYEAKARRAWGETVARRYIQRVQILQAAGTVGELYQIPPLRFHALKGERQGQHALTLTERWQLILTVRDEAGTKVRVEEVSKHYGD